MKKVLMFLLLLLAISGVLLTVQWIGYERLSSASQKVIASQTVEIEVEENGFFIKQTIYAVPEGMTLNMKLPADAKEVSCSKGDECVTGSQSGTITVENKEASIQFKIPSALSPQSFLLTNWQASFKEISPAKTTLLVADHTKRGGQWISSIEQTAAKQLSEIDFYWFEGAEEQPPLFWQKTEFKMSRFSGVTIFADEPIQLSSQLKSIPFSENGLGRQTVVISTAIKPQQAGGLTFIRKKSDLNMIHTNAVYAYVKKHFIFPKDEQWMASILAVSLYGAKPMHMKAATMNGQIMAVLTEQEERKWEKSLMQLKGKEVSAAKLDQALSEVKGEHTKFFTENKSSGSPSAPLGFFDGRPVKVEGQPASFHMKTKEGVLYIPLQNAAKALGFSVQEVSSQHWLMKKGVESYEFYPRENRVLLNNRPYALYKNALKQMDGGIYIDKIWFQKIFLVEVQESKTEIQLKSYGL